METKKPGLQLVLHTQCLVLQWFIQRVLSLTLVLWWPSRRGVLILRQWRTLLTHLGTPVSPPPPPPPPVTLPSPPPRERERMTPDPRNTRGGEDQCVRERELSAEIHREVCFIWRVFGDFTVCLFFRPTGESKAAAVPTVQTEPRLLHHHFLCSSSF